MAYTYRTFRSSPEWQRLVTHVKATRPPVCALPVCIHPHGRAIDMTLSGRAKWGPHVCHVIDVMDDPTGQHWFDPANVVLGHHGCNVDEGLRARGKRNQATIRARWATRQVGGGSNHGQPTPTKTPASFSRLSSSAGGGSPDSWCPVAEGAA